MTLKIVLLLIDGLSVSVAEIMVLPAPVIVKILELTVATEVSLLLKFQIPFHSETGGLILNGELP